MVFGLGALELLISATLLMIALSMMGQYWTGALGLGLALALSSTALVLHITGTQSPVGRAALSMLLFEDIAIVPIIFLLGAMAPFAETGGWAGAWDALWQGALMVALLLVVGRFALPRLFAQAARTKSPELFLAASLLVVIGASLATAAVGLSPIVGALIAGLLIAETEYHGEVEGITAPFKGLALGVFLITVGMSIDITTIWANFWTILLAVVGVLTLQGCSDRIASAHYGRTARHCHRGWYSNGQSVRNHTDCPCRRKLRTAHSTWHCAILANCHCNRVDDHTAARAVGPAYCAPN